MTLFRATLGTMAILLAGCIAGRTAAAGEGGLAREKIVLRSAISVDLAANSVVLPLFRGEADGRSVWYIVTDSSDAADAAGRGVVHAPLLAYARHVQKVARRGDTLVFAAAPDFSPRRVFTPGETGFPPSRAEPGAIAGAAYAPLIRMEGSEIILNAPVVAVGEGPFDLAAHDSTLDRVLAIDTEKRTVTLLLSRGFAEGREVVYISTEASDPAVAAVERAIHLPALADGSNAEIAIHAVVNGQSGRDNPDSQGLTHATRDGNLDLNATMANAAALGSARTILTAFPTGATASGYSPLWHLNMAVWSDRAVAERRNIRMTGQAELYRRVATGDIAGPQGRTFGPAGIVVNCPVIAFVDAAP